MDYVEQQFDDFNNNPFYDDLYGVPFKMKFQAGDEVEVVGNMSGHNQIGLCGAVTGYVGQFVRIEGSHMNFYEVDLKLLALPKAKVQERCQKARAKYHLWQAKLDFVEETHAEEFKSEEFEKYALKRLVENQNLSSDDKVGMIQAIFTEDR